MTILEKAELTASKSEIPFYNSEVPDTAGRKTRRRRRTQAVTKCYVFHAYAKMGRIFVNKLQIYFSAVMFFEST